MERQSLLPEKSPDLASLARAWSDCRRCPLAVSRRATVPGNGCAPGGLTIVTDRVTGYEENAGELFSGPAGAMLDRILAAPKVEIPRDRVYVASLVLCRATRDRKPRPAEVSACAERFRDELSLADPVLIVALGRCVADALGPAPEDGSPWRVWESGSRPVPVFSTIHPRDGIWGAEVDVRRRKRTMYDDWQAISARFRDLR